MSRTRPSTRPIAVSAATAAEMLGCSRQHIHNLVNRGELRRRQIGTSKAVRIPIEDVYAVLGLDAPDGAA